MSEDALRITNTVAKLQKEFKCGICCSTFKDPILSTCYHIFCRSCMNACFERKRKVQCPICRTVLDKRSCRDSYQITMAVQNYLKLSNAFKQDIENMNTFRALPPEKVFMESQAPLDVTIIPENDGKRCAPDFAIPLLPVRRKRTSRPSLPEEPTTSAAPPAPEPSFFAAPAPPTTSEAKTVPKEAKKRKKDAETSTDAWKIIPSELRTVDIEEHIATIRQNEASVDEIDALFQLIPSMRQFLQKNANLLVEKLGVAGSSDANKKHKKHSDKRVSFANSQELEKHRYLEPEAPEEIPEVRRPVKREVDEVVEDSEEEEEKKDDDTQPMEVDHVADVKMESPAPEVSAKVDEIAEKLSGLPKNIVCSRIHNDEDEVELLSDFYHKFLSTECRFSEDVNPYTTHLVMMNSEGSSIPQKSTAYLQAIARKCVILGRQWLVDCLKAGRLLRETDYMITTCTSPIGAPVTRNPVIGWIRSRADEQGKLFEGCRFMILRRFTMNPYFDYKQLIELVTLCGGEILSSYEKSSPEKLYIIFSKHSKAIEESKRMEEIHKCQVVTMEWVLDSISEYSILPTDTYKAVDSIGEQEN
uniref:RING-type E3 ubiquitin transferase BRCA1 n=1 Tax=Caenorhabditis tropicalis TaxID=1561998 RepID=A0A1I7TFR4_9PELO